MQEMKNWIALIIALTLTLPLAAQTVEWDVRGPNSSNTNRASTLAAPNSNYDDADQTEDQADDDDAAKKEDEDTEETND